VSPRVTLTRGTATGTITNDDAFVQVPALDWRGLVLLVLGIALLGGVLARRDAA
jgi:hypothetical protein